VPEGQNPKMFLLRFFACKGGWKGGVSSSGLQPSPFIVRIDVVLRLMPWNPGVTFSEHDLRLSVAKILAWEA